MLIAEAGCSCLRTVCISPPGDADAVREEEPISRSAGPGGAVYKDAFQAEVPVTEDLKSRASQNIPPFETWLHPCLPCFYWYFQYNLYLGLVVKTCHYLGG